MLICRGEKTRDALEYLQIVTPNNKKAHGRGSVVTPIYAFADFVVFFRPS